MKTILSLLGSIVFLILFTTANAVTCFPNSWEPNRTVETNCDYPVGYRISGDMYTGPYTVNVTNGTMGINLTTNRITFTTWRVMFYNGKADATVSTTFNPYVYYANGWYYPCSSGVPVGGWRPVHPSWTRLMTTQEWYPMPVWGWYFYCWK
jgi:hypothetical protein